MENELVVCAAAFFRSKGKTVITETEFLMEISITNHWMPYKEAKLLLSKLLEENILEKNGEYVKPTFDISEVNVPVAYRPPADLVKSEKTKKSTDAVVEDVFPSLVEEAVELGMKKKDFISESNNLQKKLNIDIEAAGLIVLRDHGYNVDEIADRIYESIISK